VACECCCRCVPDPITDAERSSAARIRMVVDRKRGVKTPTWIKALAKGPHFGS
jgi:hypothetical protein